MGGAGVSCCRDAAGAVAQFTEVLHKAYVFNMNFHGGFG